MEALGRAGFRRGLEGRAALERPAVDRTIYTDSSSQMVSSLVLASAALADPVLLSTAERVSDFVWSAGMRHGTGVCHYFELPGGGPGLWGQPSDQVYFLAAQIDLYQATGGARFLARARELADLLVERYRAEQGWVLEPGEGVGQPGAPESVALGDAPVDAPDIIVNGHAARMLLALDTLAPEQGYGEAAVRILESFADSYRTYAYFAAGYALAADTQTGGIVEVRVNPGVAGETRKEMVSAALAAYHPRKLIRLESVEDYVAADEGAPAPPAVVCSTGHCLQVNSAAEVAGALGSATGEVAGE